MRLESSPSMSAAGVLEVNREGEKRMPSDSAGRNLSVGDSVLVTRVPKELLSGLPNEDQEAISRCAGQHFTIAGFDDHGHAEIDFIDQHGNPHTIWIQPDCLEKL